MHFTATQHDFNRGLSIVSHAVPNRPTLAIQSYILATSDGEQIRLSAMKEDLGIHCWIPTEWIEEGGTTLLPARLMADFVGNLPSSPVTITAPSPKDPASCNIQCLRIHADMKNAGEDLAEFPSIPAFAHGGETLLLLDAELLKQIIGQIAFAASNKDDGRPALTGLQIEISNGRAVFAAADSYRVAVRTILVPDDQLCCTMLVPARTMAELAKLLPHNQTVQMMLTPGRNHILFHTETMDLSSRLLDDPFPNVRNALPRTYTTRAVLRTQDLADAIKLTLPFANSGKHTVRLKISGTDGENPSADREANTIKLEAVAQDVGNNENVVPAQVEGPDQEIALHVGYLADILSVIEESEVALEITAPSRPVVIKPVGLTDTVYVMMLMHDQQATPAAIPSEQERIASIPTVATR